MAISLAGIFVYPVKSLRGVALQEAVVGGGRLRGDREWLLLNADDRFMHQRDYPRMARIRVTPAPDGLSFGAAGQPDLVVSRPATDLPTEYVHLWRRLAPVRHVSDAADKWFATALGVSARLMAFAPERASLEGPSWEANSSLQDATPFHLTSQDSLDDLNRRIGRPIPMNRFRPNLVLTGAAPYAEDSWQDISVGPITLRWTKPCTRCKLTMTDQETGERPSGEPLRTLATYRRLGSEVVFGHYFTALTDGDLHLADQLRILATHDSPMAGAGDPA